MEAISPKELLKEIYSTIDQGKRRFGTTGCVIVNHTCLSERITKDEKAAMPLQERRRKLKEQFERILGYLAKENPEKLAEFKAWEVGHVLPAVSWLR